MDTYRKLTLNEVTNLIRDYNNQSHRAAFVTYAVSIYGPNVARVVTKIENRYSDENYYDAIDSVKAFDDVGSEMPPNLALPWWVEQIQKNKDEYIRILARYPTHGEWDQEEAIEEILRDSLGYEDSDLPIVAGEFFVGMPTDFPAIYIKESTDV